MTILLRYVGCDISKRFFDIYDPSGGARRWANDEDGAAAFAATVAGAPVIVVLEATGAYDGVVRAALTAAGVGYARINPVRARRFAQAKGLLAKTDAIDARMLADLGRALELDADPPDDPARKALDALATRRDQLVQMRADEMKRRHGAGARADRSIEEHIRWLAAEIKSLNREIEAHIEQSAELKQDAARLQSAPGIGPVAAALLLAQLPELGKRSPKRIAALVGLAPLNNDSGAFRGKRRIKGGRSRIRKALYMAALTARTSPRFKALYLRVLERTKAKKVALIAVARKLLVALNAVMRDKTRYA